jgi:hypothetical protein
MSSSGPIAATNAFVFVALAQAGAVNQLPLSIAVDSAPGSDAQAAMARQSTTPIATLQFPITGSASTQHPPDLISEPARSQSLRHYPCDDQLGFIRTQPDR